MNEPPRILLFPGLACDARIVEPQRGIRGRVEAMPYIEPLPGESLAAYAERYAPRIDTSTPFYLGGISFGGMLAQELAHHVNPSGLILIASCRSNAGVPRIGQLLARMVTWSPDWFVEAGKLVMPGFRRVFGIESGWQVELFRAMLREASPGLIKWSLQATIDWPGVRRPLSVPSVQVHARNDHILPLRLAGPVDRVIEQAGHAMNVSHADEVNAAINGWFARIGANPN